ncbi:MAG: amidohydrolase family protein [Desulfovibrionaceae bacterium]|nr:amidohydrolase family protein [Desulfovibrionaceae bacterium]
MPFSRREAMKAIALSGMVAALGFRAEAAENDSRPGRLRLVCVEEHVNNPDVARGSMPEMLRKAPYLTDWGRDVTDRGEADASHPRVIAAGDSLHKLMNTGEGRLRDMDAHGIDVQVLSYAASPHIVPGQAGIDLCARANDDLAAAAARHATRFAAFATLPWQEPKAAVKELERCVTRLGFRGVLLNGRSGEGFLDDARYRPVLEALNTLRVPLFLHPGLPLPQVRDAYYAGFSREVSARLSMFAWGWHNEEGVQLVRLLLSGVFDRLPQLRVISGHWGELVPFFLQRLDDSIPQDATGLRRSLTQTFREHVYVTPSGMTSLPHFLFVREVVGMDRLLFSVDYPYLSLNGARAWLESLPVSHEEKEKFACRNAEELLHL